MIRKPRIHVRILIYIGPFPVQNVAYRDGLLTMFCQNQCSLLFSFFRAFSSVEGVTENDEDKEYFTWPSHRTNSFTAWLHQYTGNYVGFVVGCGLGWGTKLCYNILKNRISEMDNKIKTYRREYLPKCHISQHFLTRTFFSLREWVRKNSFKNPLSEKQLREIKTVSLFNSRGPWDNQIRWFKNKLFMQFKRWQVKNNFFITQTLTLSLKCKCRHLKHVKANSGKILITFLMFCLLIPCKYLVILCLIMAHVAGACRG